MIIACHRLDFLAFRPKLLMHFFLAGLQDQRGDLAVMVRFVRAQVTEQVGAVADRRNFLNQQRAIVNCEQLKNTLPALNKGFAELLAGMLLLFPEFSECPALRLPAHPYADAVVNVREELRYRAVVSGYDRKKPVWNAIQQLYGL